VLVLVLVLVLLVGVRRGRDEVAEGLLGSGAWVDVVAMRGGGLGFFSCYSVWFMFEAVWVWSAWKTCSHPSLRYSLR